jgi:hypothetical protein
MFAAKLYAEAGGKVQLRIFPSEGKDGHGFYFRSPVWKKDLGEFLDGLGFPVRLQ